MPGQQAKELKPTAVTGNPIPRSTIWYCTQCTVSQAYIYSSAVVLLLLYSYALLLLCYCFIAMLCCRSAIAL